ncbi:TetR family transcriptional regulator [Pengzhenrongella sicca]|uniref:TetR family transcriptional regulator n=1 Tax=Pengzhenrongella sicca TaxID=2819238 RepID=A0A8A4ZLX7_9MICO|nr:TetR family transcriptional regulator [Pengzhenrongella sicca]
MGLEAAHADGARAAPARRSGTRQQIIDAAVALIANRGFSATSVDDIAAAAGVAKGSIFYIFGSKTDMFEQILSEGVRRLTDDLRAAGAGLTGASALAALVTELLRNVHEHPAFAKLMTAEVFRTGRHWQDSIRLVRDESMAVFADVVHEARPDLDAALVGAAVFGATLVTGLEWLAFQPERTFDEVRAAILATTHGLLPG